MPERNISLRMIAKLAAIILAGKLAFLLLNGITIDTDSYLYLTCILHFDYPFIYPYLLYLLNGLHHSLYLPVIVQCILLSITGAALINGQMISHRRKLLAAAFLALDPVSSLFSTSILAEGLFIPLLFLLLTFVLTKQRSLMIAGMTGIIAALLYLTRFAGAIFFIIYPLTLLFDSINNGRKEWLRLVPYLAGFLILLIPVKLRYNSIFGTSTLNAVSQESLWNNAAALVPHSEFRKSPSGSFELYAFSLPDSFYSTRHSIEATHIDSYSFPFHTYRKLNGSTFGQLPNDAAEAGKTGLKLIKAQPSKYIELFVWPNFKRVFKETDRTVPGAQLSEYVRKGFKPAVWSYAWTWISACGLLLLILFRLNPGNSGSRAVVFTLLGYFLFLPIVSPMVVRYYMILLPLVVILLFSEDKKKAA